MLVSIIDVMNGFRKKKEFCLVLLQSSVYEGMYTLSPDLILHFFNGWAARKAFNFIKKIFNPLSDVCLANMFSHTVVPFSF